MKNLIVIVLALFLVSCSDRDDRYGGVGYPTGGYNGVTTYHNKLVHQESHTSYVSQPYTYPLYFEYTGFTLVLQASNVSNEANVQVEVSDFNGEVIYTTTFLVNSTSLQKASVNLNRRPGYVTIDIPDFQGDLIITMESDPR